MAQWSFYVLWSVRDAPRQFISKSNRKCFQVHVPLPLPEHLVVFGLGEWRSSEATISVDVVVGAGVPAQRIGTMSAHARCVIWEGGWSRDVLAVAAERGRRGVYGKIVLTVCGEETAGDLSSVHRGQTKCLFPDAHDATDLSCTLYRSSVNETVAADSSHLGDGVGDGEIQVNKIDTSDSTSDSTKPPVWPTEKTPRRTMISRGHLSWSSEDVDALGGGRASTPKKQRLSRMSGQEELTAQIRNANREARPSKRWSHAMCLSDRDTAVLVGGETDGTCCEDSLWKLELDSDFWFPMDSSASGPVPPCARGHSAAFDPDSKSVFVYGGLREGQRYSDLYVLDTLTWSWRTVAAKGNIPKLAYHSATFYKKELFVFGGVHPSGGGGSGEKSCSGALYIYNPEFQLWYQPIVEGERPLPRFGHSATLMSDKLMIFGGRTTASYLNDLHVLDLGFMEYTAAKCGNMPPLPRGFHAAAAVSGSRILVSGGCSAIGALRDAHVVDLDTNTWRAVSAGPLCSRPRAGHSLLTLGGSAPDGDHRRTLLVFGGSDCCGAFYDDTIKCSVEIPDGQ